MNPLAAHESAHGVAAVVLDLPLLELSLGDPPFAAVRNSNERALVPAAILVGLAGLIAEHRCAEALGQPLPADYAEGAANSQDMRQVATLVESLGLEHDEHFDAAEAYLERLNLRAVRLVDRHWETILLVASELERRGHLTGAEVAELVFNGPLPPPLNPAQWTARFKEIERQVTGVDPAA